MHALPVLPIIGLHVIPVFPIIDMHAIPMFPISGRTSGSIFNFACGEKYTRVGRGGGAPRSLLRHAQLSPAIGANAPDGAGGSPGRGNLGQERRLQTALGRPEAKGQITALAAKKVSGATMRADSCAQTQTKWRAAPIASALARYRGNEGQLYHTV